MATTHDDDSIQQRGQAQARIAITFLVLSWFFVALRIWTRTCTIHNFGWDDGTIILATALFSAYCATMLYIEANGGGTHVTKIEELVDLTKWTIVGEATYVLTVMVLKISLGIFFTRIVIRRSQLYVIYTAVTCSMISSILSFFYVLLRCGNVINDYVYQQLANNCTPRSADLFVAYQQASITTLTDCILAALPILILWDANMDIRSKLSVGFILSLAAFGCVASMIRFQYVEGLTHFEDFFWNATNIAIWSTVEPGVGIIAGCLATLRPLLRSFLSKARLLQSEKHSSRGRSGTGSSNRQRWSRSMHNMPTEVGPAPNTLSIDIAYRLKSTISKRDSTDDILAAANDPFLDWQSTRSRSLEIDRRSSRTSRTSKVSESRDRPLPPLPPLPLKLAKRTTSVV
ncbi:hypothetical protein EJ04DRAFT_518570 [Polyplosphaeria fusca]|uniref:Rhodopsin domain-containing protein n=1 Tax=Polyplosphaeria fusca TaxID=682080 RepID=A0A9P4RC22_9PLEO|nr:hypothetical protein EJ04DRAFT_518570 [Polyplosphaeria fusca]